MADNVAITAGAGTTVATDDVGGVHYQIVKVAIGALDTANLITAGSGVVGTGTIRVTLATDVALPAGTNAIGTLAANSGVDIGDVDVTSLTGVATSVVYSSGQLTNADVDALEDIGTITVQGRTRLFFTVDVTTAALSEFEIHIQASAAGSFVTIASATADFTTPEGRILDTDGGDMTALGTSTTGWVNLDVAGVYAVKIRAAGTNTGMTVDYGLT